MDSTTVDKHGRRASAANVSGLSRDAVDSNQATAWAHQLIFCKSTPLADILVSGVFRLDRPDETLASLSAIYPIDRLALTDYVVE